MIMINEVYLLASSYVRKFKKNHYIFLCLLHIEKKKKRREEGFVK